MIDQHTVAKSLVINERGEVLILMRGHGHHRPNEPDLPGGGVDQGEAELIGAIREIKEETGIVVDSHDMRLDYAKTYLYEGRHISATKLLYTVHLKTSVDVALDGREHKGYEWCSAGELRQKYSFGEFYDEALSYMTDHKLF
jgi:8-oxo-dGTP pyrophosphatase MutT (NUDIX family)